MGLGTSYDRLAEIVICSYLHSVLLAIKLLPGLLTIRSAVYSRAETYTYLHKVR